MVVSAIRVTWRRGREGVVVTGEKHSCCRRPSVCGARPGASAPTRS